MTTLGYQKRNERFISMKTLVKKINFLLKDIFSLIFKSKDSF